MPSGTAKDKILSQSSEELCLNSVGNFCFNQISKGKSHASRYSLMHTVQQNWTDNNLAVKIHVFSIRYYGNLYRYKPGKFAGVHRQSCKIIAIGFFQSLFYKGIFQNNENTINSCLISMRMW